MRLDRPALRGDAVLERIAAVGRALALLHTHRIAGVACRMAQTRRKAFKWHLSIRGSSCRPRPAWITVEN